MPRRPALLTLAALCSFALVVAGCGGDDGDEDSAGTTTTAAETSTTVVAAEVDCDAYLSLTGLFGEADQIAQGSNDAQVAADEALADAVEALTPAAAGDAELTAALGTLGEVSFQVTDDPDAGPAPEDVDAALAAVDDAWAGDCAVEEGTETTEPAEDDGEASEGDTGSGGTVPECPAPEVLEAEGFSCDSEGHLTPLDEETVGECPAPEVLEAEGYTCDSEGNLTPVDEPDDGTVPEDDGGTQVEECPAPEVLEAQGLQCDSEGNLTPIE